jgi:hypothetical protein
MSPVHAIDLELDASGAPHLGQDRVVFVAGAAERRSAIAGVRLGATAVALLPISRDSTHFGLLSLLVTGGESEAPSWWVDYPNGMDPAPVATTEWCGPPRVLQVGVVAADGRVNDIKTLAVAPAIREIAVSSTARVAASRTRSASPWVAFVTSDGVVARPLRCD